MPRQEADDPDGHHDGDPDQETRDQVIAQSARKAAATTLAVARVVVDVVVGRSIGSATRVHSGAGYAARLDSAFADGFLRRGFLRGRLGSDDGLRGGLLGRRRSSWSRQVLGLRLGLVVSLVAFSALPRRTLGRRSFVLAGQVALALLVRLEIGLVPAAAREAEHRRRHQAQQRVLAAFGALPQRLVGELLQRLQVVVALLALVFVDRHGRSGAVQRGLG